MVRLKTRLPSAMRLMSTPAPTKRALTPICSASRPPSGDGDRLDAPGDGAPGGEDAPAFGVGRGRHPDGLAGDVADRAGRAHEEAPAPPTAPTEVDSPKPSAPRPPMSPADADAPGHRLDGVAPAEEQRADQRAHRLAALIRPKTTRRPGPARAARPQLVLDDQRFQGIGRRDQEVAGGEDQQQVEDGPVLPDPFVAIGRIVDEAGDGALAAASLRARARACAPAASRRWRTRS